MMLKNVRSEIGDLGWLVRMLTLAAVVGAIYRELRLPAEERTWHGRLLGFVPYDFRPPTPRRVIDAFWNPKSTRLFHDQPFGVGWAVNVPAALSLVGGLSRRSEPKRPAQTAQTARPARTKTPKTTGA
ncbi:MAG TPA: hypothetical protein VEW45_03090 [Candidatus Dormibacteraeota bacterium]|nr:hypothetical protein [Candidatus Dormibacteraeota bacterium]